MSAATCHHGHGWLSVDSETSSRGVRRSVAAGSGIGMVVVVACRSVVVDIYRDGRREAIISHTTFLTAIS